MRKTFGTVLVVATVFVASLHGQEPFFSWDRLTLRRTFQSQSLQASPASLTLTAPGGQKSSYAINAAVGYNVAWGGISERLECDVNVEYQRNSQIEKQQNVLLSGLAFDWMPLTVSTCGWSLDCIGKAEYKYDAVDSSKSIQLGANLTPVFPGHGMDPAFLWVPGVYSDFGFMLFRYVPYAGLEYEGAISTVPASVPDRSLRFTSRVEVMVMPAQHLLDSAVVLNASIDYKRECLGGTIGPVRDHRLLKAGLEAVLFRTADGKKSAGVGIDYTRGEDPSVGLRNQELIKLAFMIKL